MSSSAASQNKTVITIQHWVDHDLCDDISVEGLSWEELSQFIKDHCSVNSDTARWYHS